MAGDEEKGNVNHVELSGSAVREETLTTTERARFATHEEHNLSFLQAVKRYKKACFWTMIVSLTIIMDGYDTALLGSLQAYPSFQRQFGHRVGNSEKYQLDARWQVALGLSTPLGNIIGVYINSIATEKFGHKKTLIGTLIYLIGAIFVPFFGTSIAMLFAGEMLCGIAWGVFTTMAPAYASEVCPVILRSYFQNYIVLCWGIGQLVSFGVLSSMASRTSDPWAWRIPIAVQWFWPLVVGSIMFFAPESPWWLVRNGRTEEATKVVKRLSNMDQTAAEDAVAMMIHTNNLEKAMVKGTSYADCFKSANIRRTEIACAVYAIQQFSGFVVSGYGTYFFQQAGLKPVDSFHMSVGQGGLHFVANMVGFWITGKVGRRPLYLSGVGGASLFWFLIGFVALAPASVAQGYTESALYFCWYLVYQISIGPVTYIVVGEVSSTRLRSQTIGLARNTYNIVTVLNSVVGPYILNPTKGNWKGKCGFLTGGILIFCLVWAWFRLPEMKGRTYEELDILFARNLKARDFKEERVDTLGEEGMENSEKVH